jgi:predicted phage tail protein
MRYFLQRTHISEHQSAKLLDWVCGVPKMILHGAFGWFQRHVENLTLHVVKPTVVAAAQSILFHAAIFQRGASVAATKE